MGAGTVGVSFFFFFAGTASPGFLSCVAFVVSLLRSAVTLSSSIMVFLKKK